MPAWVTGGTHYTYTNAAIVNNKVFVPWYDDYSSQNAAALAVFQAAMPDHAVIQVDTSAIIGASGAIHCVMKQVPAPAAVEVPSASPAARLLLGLLLVASGAYLARRRGSKRGRG